MAPAAGYALLILYAATRPGTDVPAVDVPGGTIGLHLAEYFVFGVLLMIPVLGLRWRWRLLALAAGIAYAAFDEFLQTTVPGRHGDPMDVVVDVAGLLLAVALGEVVVPTETAAKTG